MRNQTSKKLLGKSKDLRLRRWLGFPWDNHLSVLGVLGGQNLALYLFIICLTSYIMVLSKEL